VYVVPRATWGAKPWATAVHSVPMSDRRAVLVHYHGNPPRSSTGAAVPRDVDAIHRSNGWAGIGYNFVIDLDGVVYEGRGWDLVGAHCPGHNRDGIGVYVAVGGAQKPTEAALNAARDVYDEACRRAGRTLRQSWHGYDYATACPGLPLIGWVKSGMPRTAGGAAPAPAVPAVAKPGPPVIARTLRLRFIRTRGEDVRAVQRVLGFTGRDLDGIYGPATQTVVARWQAAHNLDPDGVVGPITARAMGLRWA